MCVGDKSINISLLEKAVYSCNIREAGIGVISGWEMCGTHFIIVLKTA